MISEKENNGVIFTYISVLGLSKKRALACSLNYIVKHDCR